MSDAKSYQQMQAFFQRWSELYEAATWQGWLTGYLMAGGSKTPWYEQAMSWLDIEQPAELSQQDQHFLIQFEHQTRMQLGCDFVLLLPEDKTPLVQRVLSLASWAEAFLLGFSIYPLEQRNFSRDLKDALQDMVKISQIAVDEDEESEHLEIYYQNIVSHLQVLISVVHDEAKQLLGSVH